MSQAEPATNGHPDGDGRDGLGDAALDQMGLMAVEEAQRRDNTLLGEVLEQLTETNLSALTETQNDLLSNLVVRDWVLGVFNKAEHWSARVQLQIIKEQFYNMFPSPKSPMQGAFRAAVANDADERLEALTKQAKFQVETFFEALKSRLTRSKDGELLERIDPSISEAHVSDDSSGDERTGLLGRVKS